MLSEGEPSPFTKGSGRLELADAILRQPIAMRVIVSRVWKGHFGTGLVDTPMAKGWEAAYELWNTRSPMRRPAKPEDIADVVAGFCSSDYVTGEILIADGGLNLT